MLAVMTAAVSELSAMEIFAGLGLALALGLLVGLEREWSRNRVAGIRTCALITVEEHSVHGGLGGACAEVLMQAGFALPFKIVAIPDEYTATGSQPEIFAHYGITPTGLAQVAEQLLAGAGASHAAR